MTSSPVKQSSNLTYPHAQAGNRGACQGKGPAGGQRRVPDHQPRIAPDRPPSILGPSRQGLTLFVKVLSDSQQFEGYSAEIPESWCSAGNAPELAPRACGLLTWRMCTALDIPTENPLALSCFDSPTATAPPTATLLDELGGFLLTATKQERRAQRTRPVCREHWQPRLRAPATLLGVEMDKFTRHVRNPPWVASASHLCSIRDRHRRLEAF